MAVEAAEHNVIRGLEDGLIETEPSLTDRLLGGLEVAFNSPQRGLRADRFDLKLRTLRDRGPNAPEREFGADLVWIFDVKIPSCTLAKGALIQAKWAGRGGVTIGSGNNHRTEISVSVSNRDPSTPTSLFAQCVSMLSITSESYVFVYSLDGVFVVPAISVVSLACGGRPTVVYSKTLRHFVSDFLQCFCGDGLLNATDDDTLRNVRDRCRARSALMLSFLEHG